MLYLLTLIGIIATAAAFVYDGAILKWVATIQNPLLTQIMVVFTTLGAIYVGIPIVLILAYALEKRKDKEIFWNIIAADIITEIVTVILKLLFNRDRPTVSFANYSNIDADFQSFPSGHSSRAFAVMSVLGDFRRKYAILFYAFAFMVALSRVYIGAHYASDVIFGSMMGMLLSTLSIEAGIGDRLRKFVLKFIKGRLK